MPLAIGQGIGIPFDRAGVWWPAGASMAIDFRSNRAFGVSVGDITATRATGGTALDLAGNIVTFGSNVMRRTNRGLLIEAARTNLFLNSLAPVTQTIAVAAASTYTISRGAGAGTVTLSDALTGTPTFGVPVTGAAATASLTVTVTGSVAWVQVELGGHASSLIQTAGASVTRDFDDIFIPNIDSAGWFSAARTTEGIFVGTVRDLGNPTVTCRVMALNSSGVSTVGNAFAFGINNTTTTSVAGGATSTTATIPTLTAARRRFAGGYRVSDTRFSVSADGNVFGTNTTSDYTGVGANQLQFGSRSSVGSQILNGYLEDLAFIPTAGLLASGATMNPLTVF
jgi:hypothetical protein